MARQIKFRAWDKTNNEWYMGGESFDLNFSGSYGDFFFDNDNPGNMRDVRLVWCQFTGLLDRLGVQIFDGDIVRIHGAVARPPTGVIHYDRAAWFIGGDDGWRLGSFNQDDIEIIGNTFEKSQPTTEQT